MAIIPIERSARDVPSAGPDVVNSIEAVSRQPVVDHPRTAQLRAELLHTLRGEAAEERASLAAITRSSQVERETIERMNRPELTRHVTARQGSPEDVEASLQHARERIAREVEARDPPARSALADRFNITGTAGQRHFEFRNRPGQAAFSERWLTIQTTSDSQAVVRAMVERAQERGWTAFRLKGTPEFQRQAWIAAEARGIKAVGYEPTSGDRQAAREEYARLHPARAQTAERKAVEPGPAAVEPAKGGSMTRTTKRPPARRDAVMAALEQAMHASRVPNAQRDRVREAVTRELSQRAARHQVVAAHEAAPAAKVSRIAPVTRAERDRSR